MTRGGAGFLDKGEVQFLKGVWGQKSPSRVQGQSPWWGSGVTALRSWRNIANCTHSKSIFCAQHVASKRTYSLLNICYNGSRGILTCQILPSDCELKLHWKFELTLLHYLIYLWCFIGGRGSMLNFLLGFASISRVSLTRAGGLDPWTPWPAPHLTMT